MRNTHRRHYTYSLPHDLWATLKAYADAYILHRH